MSGPGRPWGRRRALLLPALAPLPVRAQRMPEVEAAWAGLGEAVRGWMPALSPPLPSSWPPDGRVRRYAFAYRPRPGLADGAEVAAPWAIVEREVTVLDRTLTPLGIQGVRPLRAEEIALAERDAEVAALLAGPPDAAGAALVRAFHCGWAGRQGVIARDILARHPDFAAWLGCG